MALGMSRIRASTLEHTDGTRPGGPRRARGDRAGIRFDRGQRHLRPGSRPRVYTTRLSSSHPGPGTRYSGIDGPRTRIPVLVLADRTDWSEARWHIGRREVTSAASGSAMSDPSWTPDAFPSSERSATPSR